MPAAGGGVGNKFSNTSNAVDGGLLPLIRRGVGAGDGTGVGAFVGAGVTGCNNCLRCSSSECICVRNLARARPWGMPSKDTMALSESISALRSLTSVRFSASSVFSCLRSILWYWRSSWRSCCVRSDLLSVPASAASVARSSAVNVGIPLGKECANRERNATTTKHGRIISVLPAGSVDTSILYAQRFTQHGAHRVTCCPFWWYKAAVPLCSFIFLNDTLQ